MDNPIPVTWISSLLQSSNPLVKYGVGALIVFGPLYILQSYGQRWAFGIAFIIFVGFLLRKIGEEGLTIG